jgi:hypothetical protein
MFTLFESVNIVEATLLSLFSDEWLRLLLAAASDDTTGDCGIGNPFRWV